MKVLLLGFGKIAYMPYMNFYIDALHDIKEIEYDLIYWDRDGKPDAQIPEPIQNAYRFQAHLEEQFPFRKKLKYFIQYRKFALKILKEKMYDRIIVLHTTPGLTLIDYLRKHYCQKYVLDFRDVSYEYIPIYKKLVGVLVKGSAITYVSSNAFRKFLPKLDNIYTIHNYLEESLNHRMLRKKEPRERAVIRVCYWGLVRQVDVNAKLMDALGNDHRFELHYYGRMQQDGRDMEEYARSHNFSNVYFHGQYMPIERYVFAAQTDLIHNVYDLGHTTGNAMGNKYYDGVIFGIPQICTRGSYMGQLVSEHEVGINIDIEDTSIADKLWDYYNSLDFAQFERRCIDATEAVVNEQYDAKRHLLAFIR